MTHTPGAHKNARDRLDARSEAPEPVVAYQRIAVTHATSTVLGSPCHASDFARLDLARAVCRTQSTIMLTIVGDRAPRDLHLDVPLVDDPECVYRVRPRDRRVTNAV